MFPNKRCQVSIPGALKTVAFLLVERSKNCVLLLCVPRLFGKATAMKAAPG